VVDTPAERNAQHPLEPLLHLRRGLVRKGDREDAAGVDAALANEVRDPARDHAGLAAPCAREDQKRPIAVQHRLALGGIQLLKIVHGISKLPLQIAYFTEQPGKLQD
jgi:hypothetical protein